MTPSLARTLLLCVIVAGLALAVFLLWREARNAIDETELVPDDEAWGADGRYRGRAPLRPVPREAWMSESHAGRKPWR
jgi:hypothetical protein